MEHPATVHDIHTHLFNTCHTPVIGVLRQRGAPKSVATVIGIFLNALTVANSLLTAEECAPHREAFTAADDIEALHASITSLTSFTIWKQTLQEQRLSSIRDKREQLLYATITSSRLYKSIVIIQRHINAEEGTLDSLLRVSDLIGFYEVDGEERNHHEMLDNLTSLLEERLSAPMRWVVKRLSNLVSDAYSTAMDYARFAVLMLLNESTLLKSYTNGYNGSQNVKRSLHLMMDMRHGYPHAPAPLYSYRKQVERMLALTDAHRDSIACFVAFDPRRGDPSIGNGHERTGLDIVKEAIAKGFAGVKIYPPMGYLPLGNTDWQNEQCLALYNWCANESIPVLTHCTPQGAECRTGAGLNSDPDNWSAVFDKLEEPNKFKLCYGHAGGGSFDIPGRSGRKERFPGWYSKDSEWRKDSNNYAFKVVEHCTLYDSVYCDISYMHEIVQKWETLDLFRANLMRAFNTTSGQCKFADKIMYGSDWHMPSINRHAGKFLELLVDMFSKDFPDYGERFFSSNALKYMNRHATT